MSPKPHTPPAKTVLRLAAALATAALLPAASASQAPAQTRAATATTAATATAGNTPATTPANTATTAAPATGRDTATAMADKLAAHFLDNYLGIWEGETELRSLDGQFRDRVQLRITYSRDPQDPARITGLAVFAAGNRTVHATSLTFVEDGRLISVIDRSGAKTAYTGTPSPDGRGITWRERERIDALNAYHKETFQEEGDTLTLLIEGYEDYRNQGVLLTQKTLLRRVAR